ncbi:MAG: exonuclease domain-containing protein [Burkholderiaceae bacterium]
MPAQALAFVDIETSGSTPNRDGITEIAVIRLEEGRVRRWERLINPETVIPSFIESLTGIRNEMVADAPTFRDVAAELHDELAGCIFVAHNARFDYSFIKQGFASTGLAFRAPTLCTVKLSRRLFPLERRHNLDTLIERHGLAPIGRHRAMADADLLLQFWNVLEASIGQSALWDAVGALIARPSLPSHIESSVIDELPNSPGVYLFYGENDLPLYIGKSKDIRSRVMSHFSGDIRSSRELQMSQQVRRIESRMTGGEVGALLLEAALVKSMKPIFNRQLRLTRSVSTLVLGAPEDLPQVQPMEVTQAIRHHPGRCHGLYETVTEAQRALRSMAEANTLCKAFLGLEKRVHGRACFGLQLGRCKGICDGREDPREHHLRLSLVLTSVRVKDWPFEGAAYLREGDSVLVFRDWAFLGEAQNEDDLQACLSGEQTVQFDRDTYRILSRVVGRMMPIASELQAASSRDGA